MRFTYVRCGGRPPRQRHSRTCIAFIWRTHKNTFTRAPKAAAKAYHIIFKALFSSAGNARYVRVILKQLLFLLFLPFHPQNLLNLTIKINSLQYHIYLLKAKKKAQA
jgi:hypothetical protein